MDVGRTRAALLPSTASALLTGALGSPSVSAGLRSSRYMVSDLIACIADDDVRHRLTLRKVVNVSAPILIQDANMIISSPTLETKVLRLTYRAPSA